MAERYVFHPMSSGDLPLIKGWLETPEVVRWWGRPDEQYALVSGDLNDPDMDQFMVALGERPFGYIQCYPLSTWNQGFGAQPSKTRGIDLTNDTCPYSSSKVRWLPKIGRPCWKVRSVAMPPSASQ